MWKKVLGTSMLLLIATAAAPAMAATQVNTPFGSAPVVAVVGSRTFPNPWPVPIIVWQRVSDGSCSVQQLGSAAGLSADYEVHGGSGNDLIVVLGENGENFCGIPLTEIVYNGHYLDIFGGSGNDRLKCARGDTWLFGEAGNDHLYSQNPNGAQLGGTGNDSIIYGGQSGTAALYGEDGDDCLSSEFPRAIVMDCGSGNDRWLLATQPPGGPVACETPASACGPW